MQIFIALCTGLLFGIGLIVSGMFNPAKVLAFLDIAGNWDPSLLGTPMLLPTANRIDQPLVLGSLTFGIGWGLAGFCPGPALVALGTGELKAFIFVGAMLAGMAVFELIEGTEFPVRPQPTAHR
ncbi:DUF6691 family protein [Undibacterium arcticum]|uniref:DUF6691 family protein n=1 Tax=Undibacterium arcticum TaxID=1762892 RepID=A0ABV7F485_9BURK